MGHDGNLFGSQAQIVALSVVHLPTALNVKLLITEGAGIVLPLQVLSLDVTDHVTMGHVAIIAAKADPPVVRDLSGKGINLFFCKATERERKK